MKRPIKFRGKRSDNGEFVFGSYCREVYRDLGTLHAIIDEGGEEFIVDEDSIAQLVGFDSEGNEIYEGDTVAGVDEDWVAVLVPDILHSKEDIKDVPFKFLTLKEAES